MKVKKDQLFQVGQRVYYRETGDFDTGTVILYSRIRGDWCYQVVWDNDDETDWYSPGQLAHSNYQLSGA